jgi:maltooligosyltrehalose trehalohydrolase
VRRRPGSPPAWRRLPIGAELAPKGGVHSRVWAPRLERVTVQLGDREAGLDAEPAGYHASLTPAIGTGTQYRYRLDDGPAYPDPASRFQPAGPHGPSEVVVSRRARERARRRTVFLVAENEVDPADRGVLPGHSALVFGSSR